MTDSKKYTGGFSSKIIIGIVAVILLAIGIFYGLGYRVGNFGIAKLQNLTVLDLPPETQVFIDQRSRGYYEGTANIELTPGNHSIIFSRVGFWPYMENVVANEENKNTLTIRPFLILQNTNKLEILPGNPAYREISSLFKTQKLYTQEKRLISSNGLVSIYLKDGKIFALWEGEDEAKPAFFSDPLFARGTSGLEAEVFNPFTPVRSMAFFKDREDILVLAIQDGIFAIELDPREVQNLQPIYEGKEPIFQISPDAKLYVKDENKLMHLSF